TLYKLFSRDLNDLVQRYVYARLLPEPGFARWVFGQRAPLGERLRGRLFSPGPRTNPTPDPNPPSTPPERRLFEIKKVLAQVNALLADGRRSLGGGDRLTIADVAFAAAAAPLVLPEEFGGVIANIQHVPADYRKDVFDIRATAAGQFLLRV